MSYPSLGSACAIFSPSGYPDIPLALGILFKLFQGQVPLAGSASFHAFLSPLVLCKQCSSSQCAGAGLGALILTIGRAGMLK